MLDPTLLDEILHKTIAYIGKSQVDIYDIAENTRKEHELVKKELEKVKSAVVLLIKSVDKMDTQEKLARQRLVEVSKDFSRYSEADIKMAYDAAQKIQLQAATLRGQEKLLRYKRDNLERNLRRLQDVLKKAEGMMSHLGVVLKYLQKHMDNLSTQIEELIQVQQLGINIIKAQEEERKRVAREIHDGPAQLLANIVMRAEYILKLMEIDPQHVKRELVSLQDLVRQSLQDVRKIIFDLRPMVLDDLGLAPALNRYMEDYQEQHQIDAEFIFFGSQERLPPHTEVALFRVVQEALNNVQKHARAKQVLVKMEQLPNKVVIMIKDDGKGFDPLGVQQDSNHECYGLINMRERVQILKGELKLTSAPGKGTLISLVIPL